MAVTELAHGRPIGASIPTAFPLRPPATQAHFVGPVRVLELSTAGDGSYMHTSGFAFGGGALGVALIAGSIIGNAAGNARRRARAAADAQLAFRYRFDVDIFVTDAGFVLGSPLGIGHWTHHDIDMMLMVGPGQVEMQGRGNQGPLAWQLLTPYAELLFAMWALAIHPQSPQLRDGSWFPRGWLDWARSQGRDPWLRDASIRDVRELE